MMEFDQEHIRQLYLQKLTNILTPQEEQELEVAMRNPGIRRMCRELEELYASPEMQQLLREKPTSARWDELMDNVMQKEEALEVRDMGFRRYMVAACTLLVVAVGTYFLWPGYQQQSANFTASHKPALHPLEIHLKLANGELVPLSGTQARETIRTGSMQLRNQGNILRFEPGGSAGDEWNTLEVPAGRDYTVVLPDGTEVNLNSATSLRFPSSFNGNRREIEVRGEAFLKVAKNESKPFIVHSDAGDVQVLGTSFNINTYEPGILRASLVDGSIRAESHGHSQLLQPGEEVISNRFGEMKKRKFDAEKVLSWRQGTYHFDGATYASVAKVLERCYNVRVVFDNDNNQEIANSVYTGRLDKANTLRDFLDLQRNLKHIDYRMEDGVVHIFKD